MGACVPACVPASKRSPQRRGIQKAGRITTQSTAGSAVARFSTRVFQQKPQSKQGDIFLEPSVQKKPEQPADSFMTPSFYSKDQTPQPSEHNIAAELEDKNEHKEQTPKTHQQRFSSPAPSPTSPPLRIGLSRCRGASVHFCWEQEPEYQSEQDTSRLPIQSFVLSQQSPAKRCSSSTSRSGRSHSCLSPVYKLNEDLQDLVLSTKDTRRQPLAVTISTDNLVQLLENGAQSVQLSIELLA